MCECTIIWVCYRMPVKAKGQPRWFTSLQEFACLYPTTPHRGAGALHIQFWQVPRIWFSCWHKGFHLSFCLRQGLYIAQAGLKLRGPPAFASWAKIEGVCHPSQLHSASDLICHICCHHFPTPTHSKGGKVLAFSTVAISEYLLGPGMGSGPSLSRK